MNKLLLGTCLMMMPCVVFAGNYSNDNHWKYYISGTLGAVASNVVMNDERFFDFGGVTSVELGAQYNRFRLGLAWQERAETSEALQTILGHTMSVENDALRLNGYIDYVSTEHFSMYVGAGLGVNRYDYTYSTRFPRYEESNHGASFIGGFSTGMIFSAEHIGVDIGLLIDYISKPHTYSYGPTIGLRYVF